MLLYVYIGNRFKCLTFNELTHSHALKMANGRKKNQESILQPGSESHTQLSPPSMSVNLILFGNNFFFSRSTSVPLLLLFILSILHLLFAVYCLCHFATPSLWTKPTITRQKWRYYDSNGRANECVREWACNCVCECIVRLGLKLPSNTYHRHLCVHAYCI